MFNQRLAETLVDPETGEILAAEGTILDRRTLDRILPYLEKNIGFKTAKPMGGVVEGDVGRNLLRFMLLSRKANA